MRITVLFKQDHLCAFDDDNIDALIFNLKDNQVIGVESISLNNSMYISRINLLKTNNINRVYVSDIRYSHKQALLNQSISVISGDALLNDKIFKTLYFSNINSI